MRSFLLLRCGCLVGLTLLFGGCHKGVKVSFDKTSVLMGDQVHIMVEDAPPGWTGALVVNETRHFQIDSKLATVRVTVDNGFHGVRDNTLKIDLTDSRSGVLLAHDLEFHLRVTMPQFQVAKEMDLIGEAGSVGSVSVRAPAGAPWVVRGVPDWVKIVAKPEAGNGTFSYAVDPNRSNQARSAAILIGDATYFINQDPSTSIHFPFAENFSGLPTPVWELSGNGYSPTRWGIEDFEKGRSTTELSSEGREGANSLIVNRASEAKEAWQSQIYLTRLETERGGRYRADFWAKAENPGYLWIIFSRRVEPYQPCTPIKREQVSAEWTRLSYDFTGGGDRCGVDENRLSLHLGRLVGRVWISKFSIVKE